jgi:hypothetical protein
MILSKDGTESTFQALVVEDMDVDILARVPFNDISVRPARRQIILEDGTIYR